MPGFAQVLWPDEPDWNLSVDFSRTRDFAPEDLCILRAVPMTRTNGMFTANFTAAVHGSVESGLSLQPVSIHSGAEGGYLRTTDLMLNYTSSVPDLHVDLARAVDNHGRELRFGDGQVEPLVGWIRHYWAGLELAADTVTMDLTFAFHRPRRIEFTVKPTFVRTNFPWSFPPVAK